MEVATEVALRSPVVRWTLLGQPGGLAVCRQWREHVLRVGEASVGLLLCEQLCTRRARGLPLPPLRRLPAQWFASQRLAQLEALPLQEGQARGLLSVEVVIGPDDLWGDRSLFVLEGRTSLKAVAHAGHGMMQELGSLTAFTTQAEVGQTVFPGPQCTVPPCTHLLPLRDLWVSWLRQFGQQLESLEERVPFGFDSTMCFTGEVLCDLRIPYHGGWAYLRVSSIVTE